MLSKQNAIGAIVRCRPLEGSNTTMAWGFNDRKIFVRDTSGSARTELSFSLTDLYHEEATSSCIFDNNVRSMIDHVITGYNATVFAYGMSGAGKSFTMFGPSLLADGRFSEGDPDSGIIPLAIVYLFQQLGSCGSAYNVRMSYLEIYNESINDLLDSTSMNTPTIRESRESVYVTGAYVPIVNSLAEVLEFIRIGDNKRRVASTALNDRSSRSHAIIRIFIEVADKSTPAWMPTSPVDSMAGAGVSHRSSLLTFADLAGSERQAKTHAVGDRLTEANNINKSLLTLGMVIESLSSKTGFAPYRSSVLTRLLRPSLGGNAMTLVIACIRLELVHIDESTNTLRFAQKAATIVNSISANEVISDQDKLQRVQKECENLRSRVLLLEQHIREQNAGFLPASLEDRERKDSSSAAEPVAKIAPHTDGAVSPRSNPRKERIDSDASEWKERYEDLELRTLMELQKAHERNAILMASAKRREQHIMQSASAKILKLQKYKEMVCMYSRQMVGAGLLSESQLASDTLIMDTLQPGAITVHREETSVDESDASSIRKSQSSAPSRTKANDSSQHAIDSTSGKAPAKKKRAIHRPEGLDSMQQMLVQQPSSVRSICPLDKRQH